MRITEVKRVRGSLYRVWLDDEDAGSVDVRTWDESGWKLDSDISEEEWEALCERSARNRAKNKALYLLSLRDRSRGELFGKLKEEAGEDIARDTVEQMEAYGFLDDERLAARWAEDLSGRKCYPRRRVAQELVARGFTRDTAQEAADAIETEDHVLALAMLRKRYYNKMTSEDGRRKTAAALARYGFPREAIRRAFDNWENED